MAQIRHLPRAPITEAIIDIRAQNNPGTDVNIFSQLGDEIGYKSPVVINLLQMGMGFLPGSENPPPTHSFSHDVVGYRHTSPDDKYVAQFRKDGFTLSRLSPYSRWEELFAEAKRLYLIYLRISSPEEVSRIAVRYINCLPLPLDEVGDFSDFLVCPPPVPNQLKACLNGFLTQVQVQDLDSSIAGTIIQTIQQAPNIGGTVGVVLDLDIFEVGTKSPEPNAIFGRFAALREMKNHYFFSSITEKTVELFL